MKVSVVFTVAQKIYLSHWNTPLNSCSLVYWYCYVTVGIKGRDIKILKLFQICQMIAFSHVFQTGFYLIREGCCVENRIVIKNNIKAKAV